jgi:hypothetical protein
MEGTDHFTSEKDWKDDVWKSWAKYVEKQLGKYTENYFHFNI